MTPANGISDEAKLVLRAAARIIGDLTLDEKLPMWKGISDLTDESSELGQAARHNVFLLEQAIEQQKTFLEMLG